MEKIYKGMIRIGDMIITALIIGVPTILLFLSIPYILFLHCIALVDDNIVGYTVEKLGKRGKSEIHENYLVWNKLHMSKGFRKEDFSKNSWVELKDKSIILGPICDMNHETNTITIMDYNTVKVIVNMDEVFHMYI